MQHRWVTLGTSGMTDDQAKGWAGVAGPGPGIREEPLDVLFSAVICVVCKEMYGEALPECLGSPPDEDPNEHLWQAFFTHPVTEDQAAAWADPEGTMNLGLPQSIAVLCMLCGQGADTADHECKERSLWTEESRIGLSPNDFKGKRQTVTGVLRGVRWKDNPYSVGWYAICTVELDSGLTVYGKLFSGEYRDLDLSDSSLGARVELEALIISPGDGWEDAHFKHARMRFLDPPKPEN